MLTTTKRALGRKLLAYTQSMVILAHTIQDGYKVAAQVTRGVESEGTSRAIQP